MMNILCSTDDNYVPYCGIMLTSLFENNKDETITVYIQTAGLSEENSCKMRELADCYNQSIIIIKVDRHIFEHCPINTDTDHVSLTTYYRIAVADTLPKELDKVLYLDCDVIINDSLRKLYDTDLDGFACGVVVDEAFALDVHYKRLSIPMDENMPYFNAGVLLINLEYWREHNVMEQCMNYISANVERLAFHDQDTLNAVLRGKVKYLPPAFNLQKGLLLKEFYEQFPTKEQESVKAACESPVIIHFTGFNKPWIEGNRYPFVDKWLEVMRHSLWSSDTIMIKPKCSLKSLFFMVRNEIIWKLGLKKRPQSYII